jgi:hypothetical protein
MLRADWEVASKAVDKTKDPLINPMVHKLLTRVVLSKEEQ